MFSIGKHISIINIDDNHFEGCQNSTWRMLKGALGH